MTFQQIEREAARQCVDLVLRGKRPEFLMLSPDLYEIAARHGTIVEDLPIRKLEDGSVGKIVVTQSQTPDWRSRWS